MATAACLLFLLITLALTASIENTDHVMGQDLGVGLSQYRRLILNQNAQLVRNHNNDPTKTWKMQLYPRFAALTLEQISQKFLTPNLANMIDEEVKLYGGVVKPAKIVAEPTLSKNLEAARQTVDLRPRFGTPVRNQGQKCGNCYAYATIDVVDMFYRRMGINNGVTLSVQQLTDCSKNLLGRGLNYGCKGGWFLESYLYIAYYGLADSLSYPISFNTFHQGLEQPCRKVASPLYKISKPTYFADNERLSPFAASCNSRFYFLRQGLAISVAMFAGNFNFLNYKSGVLRDCSYPSNTAVGVDHAVVMVGFQTSHNPTSQTENYILIKNSWGAGWGQNGHFRVYHPQVNTGSVGKCFLCNYGYFNMY